MTSKYMKTNKENYEKEILAEPHPGYLNLVKLPGPGDRTDLSFETCLLRKQRLIANTLTVSATLSS